ncbi:COX15/CtaA family protein [Agromyces marinus]|uniref:Protein required for cytochrome oxidase assembly n=1 Tax=Agromyces marinus TaxID=1389020 RepID=A0ABM8GX24_9MICO|nr:COX15/CtaA family protein [Agromyces marinus]UIP58694.1 Heme A synthase [Agromyces marinus]BDZ53011.1 protein required for cytochrome oxidase assembly [Agromyces marinus]
MNRLIAWLPDRIDRRVRIAAWVSFVLNVVIIGTGGAVRLTGSGLGCSDWPVCVPGSLVPTPEMGIHGVIEFGNRTISGPVLLAAIAVVLFVWRIRRERRDLFVPAVLVLVLVIVQALVGAFVVWQELAATLVGFHYTVSVVIVCITAAFLARMVEPAGARELAVPRAFAVLTRITGVVLAVTVVVGVMTTASGPHSGDANVVRTGVDAELLAHVHAWPGYVLAALLATLVGWAALKRLRPLRWLLALLAVTLVQVAVGVYQARSGLPPLAVGVHMILAALAAATMTVVVLRIKRPVTTDAAPDAAAAAASAR